MFIGKEKKLRKDWKDNRVGLSFNVSEDEELAIMNEVFDAGRITIFKDKTEVDLVNMLFYSLPDRDKVKVIYFANMVKKWKKVKGKTAKEWSTLKLGTEKEKKGDGYEIKGEEKGGPGKD